MAEKDFDINQLRLWPSLIGMVVTLAIAIPVDSYLLPNRGKFVAFAVGASLLAIYTGRPMLRYSGAKAFIIGYVALHIALIFVAPTDAIFPGLALVPLFMADYVAMVFGLRFFTVPTMD